MTDKTTISPAAAILMRLRRRRPLGAQPLDLLHEEAAGEIERLDDEMARLREIMRQAAAEIERLRAALAEAQRVAREWDEYHPAFIAGAKAATAAGRNSSLGTRPQALDPLRALGSQPSR